MQCPYKNKIPNTEEESGVRQGWAAPVIAFMREGKMPRKKEDMSRKKWRLVDHIFYGAVRSGG